MVILVLFIIGIATGYELKCPAKTEWRLRGSISCLSEDKYVCLFHLLENRYTENCLGSDRSSIGSKLVFQPLFNLAKCDTGRYQPIVFTTKGNSECIYSKSKCDEEGQIVFNNGSTSNDTACRCDYTKGYAFVTRPKNSCFCKPNEEDCSCYRVTCTKLSSDYQCLNDRDKMVNGTCQKIQPIIPYNTHDTDDNTVQIIENNRKSYSNAHYVVYVIIASIATYFVFTVIAVYVIDKKEKKDDKRQETIHELFRTDTCGKLHFARLVFIGKNGVGKTSLMRRLLWHTKEDVTSTPTQSTDGIEVEKCNINIGDGTWSPSKKGDNDLTRLINQVYKKKSRNEENAAAETFVDQEQLRLNNDDSRSVSDKTYSSFNKERENKDIFKYDTDSESNKKDVAVEIGTEITNTQVTAETDCIHIQQDNFKLTNINDNKSNSYTNMTNEDDSDHVNDDYINEMTSTIMKSYLQFREKEPDDILAFCWLWDFAGQKNFYATHQVFLSRCAVYMLVTDSLEFSTSGNNEVDFDCSAKYVSFWFDVIHCYLSTTKKGRLDPPIIVVCTNEDRFKKPREREIRQQQFKENLGHVINNQDKKGHLRNIYFISNTEDNDIVFEKIRKEISRHAMDMQDWGKNCPLKWLLFQQVLLKLRESNVPISSTKTLLKIAKHKDIDISEDEDAKRCLQFCHDIGTVVYFDEENLADYVILDPKWLIKAFRCLVSNNIENIIEVSEDWKKLTDTGKLTDWLISSLFTKEPELKFEDNKSHLIEVMKRFDIIVNLRNSSELYMPCMIQSCSFADVQKQFYDGNPSFYKTSWFCLEFAFLPPAFFNHIIVWYIKQYCVSTILDENKRKKNALYCQIGVFDLDKSGCEQLVVCEGPNTIALQVWNSRKLQKTYGYLVSKLFGFVATLKQRYSLHISYTPTFTCRDGDFTLNRNTIEDIGNIDYRCLEHKINHLSDDILRPWGQYMIKRLIELTMEKKEALLVVALDFGTSYSGYAFSMRHEFKTDPLKIHATCNQPCNVGGPAAFLSLKTPTCLLLNDKKQFIAFGYEAEIMYEEIVMEDQQDKYFYFHRFKMNLHNNKNISTEMFIEDILSKPVSAVEVFSLSIKALVDNCMHTLKTQGTAMKIKDIQWVLTIPAIWTDAAKQFMRECAEKASIPAEQLILALEPETASIFCQYLPTEKLHGADQTFAMSVEGTKYMVADLGGGTADITVHEKTNDGRLKELHRASGNDCGGTSVDSRFFQMLVKILGGPLMTKIKDEDPDVYLHLFREFEAVKRTKKMGKIRKVNITIPCASLDSKCREMLGEGLNAVIASSPYGNEISLHGGKMRIDAHLILNLFKPTVDNILSLMFEILKDKKVQNVTHILLVGGFSECRLIQKAVLNTFLDKKIIIPEEAGLSVLKGAVLFGHRPDYVQSRVMRFSYGVDTTRKFDPSIHDKKYIEEVDGQIRCKNLFSKFVSKNESVEAGRRVCKEFHTFERLQTSISFRIYVSSNEDPMYTSDETCIKLSKIKLELPDPSEEKRYVDVEFVFGNTEIAIRATDRNSGKEIQTKLNLI